MSLLSAKHRLLTLLPDTVKATFSLSFNAIFTTALLGGRNMDRASNQVWCGSNQLMSSESAWTALKDSLYKFSSMHTSFSEMP